MRAKNLIPLFLACLAASSSALTPEGQKAGEELTAALNAEMKALGADQENRNEVMAIRQYLRMVQAALGQENNRQLAQMLNNFGEYEPGEKVKECVKTLGATLKEESEKKTRTTISEMEALLSTASETVVRAEEPEDLDKLIVSLSRKTRYNDDGESYNDPTIRNLLSEISSARQFVTAWQDYLQASDSGDTAQATQSLRNLAGQDKPLIPRSQIIARLEFEKADETEISKVLDQVKGLDDMKDAILKLGRMLAGSRNSGMESPGSRETLQTLAKMEKTYREHLAGLPVNVEVLQTPNDSSERGTTYDFTPLRASLLLLVLPRALDLPAELRPTQGETVAGFLTRATADATRRDDTAAAVRIATMRQTITRSSTLNGSEVEAARNYSAGLRQLEAKQYLLAVVSLQKALQSGSDLIPAVKVGEMLDAIYKDHPKEFEQGMVEYLTPNPTPQFDYSRMPYRNYMSPGMRFMDGDPRRQDGGTTIVLPVPGKVETKDQPKPASTANETSDKPEAKTPPETEK